MSIVYFPIYLPFFFRIIILLREYRVTPWGLPPEYIYIPEVPREEIKKQEEIQYTFFDFSRVGCELSFGGIICPRKNMNIFPCQYVIRIPFRRTFPQKTCEIPFIRI